MLPHKNYKLIVFDWDGTLMDSVAKIVHCMQSAAMEMQLDVPSENQVRAVIGYSMQEAIKRVFPQITASQQNKLAQFYKHYYNNRKYDCSLFDGVPELLSRLKSQNYLLAVATGKARQGLERVFSETGLKEHFIISRCADETQSKPNPQMLNEILLETGISNESALMVGDSEMDMMLAINANVDSLAVSYGAHTIEQLMQSKPKTIIHHPLELLTFLGA